MNAQEKLSLQSMINDNDVPETTNLIREIRHSSMIRDDVKMLNHLKKKHASLAVSAPDDFDAICVGTCGFLFNNYTDIFNKVKKDEIDLQTLDQFLSVLEKIEKGELDQHEGSYEVGNILKRLYVDSALRKADKLNADEPEPEPQALVKDISWKQFKMIN